jgi:hypothetical protein
MLQEFKRQLLYKSKDAIQGRRVDELYKYLAFQGPNHKFVKDEKIFEFFDLYIKSLQSGDLRRVKDRMEPRFFGELSEFLKRLPARGLRTDARRFKREKFADVRGHMLIEGVSINRFENLHFTDYLASKSEDLLVFKPIEKKIAAKRDESVSDDPIDYINDQLANSRLTRN